MVCTGTTVPLRTFLLNSDNPEFIAQSAKQFLSRGLDIITIFINPSSYEFLRLLEQCPPTAEEHGSLLVVEESKLLGLQIYRV